jgi:hypothetical protein
LAHPLLAHLGNSLRLHPFSLLAYDARMNNKKRISQEAIAAFKAAYEAEFHETLTDEEVQEMAINLLRFFGVLRRGEASRPRPGEPVN